MRAFGADFLFEKIARGIAQAPAVFQLLAHALARRDGVFQAVDPDCRLPARQANATGFFASHVDLLPRHGRAVSLGQSGISVMYFFPAPCFCLSFHFVYTCPFKHPTEQLSSQCRKCQMICGKFFCSGESQAIGTLTQVAGMNLCSAMARRKHRMITGVAKCEKSATASKSTKAIPASSRETA